MEWHKVKSYMHMIMGNQQPSLETGRFNDYPS
jgi:hypothetical protein